MLGGFQDYLVSNGWRRFDKKYRNGRFEKIENYNSNFMSSYSPLGYFFENDNYPGIELFYGLILANRPPQFDVFPCKIIDIENKEYPEDLWYRFMQSSSYEVILSCYIHKAIIEYKNGEFNIKIAKR